jgi:hypothetical protein
MAYRRAVAVPMERGAPGSRDGAYDARRGDRKDTGTECAEDPPRRPRGHWATNTVRCMKWDIGHR